MDLLGSILNSMDKPPSMSEKDRKMAKVVKERQEKEQKKEQERKENFKAEAEKQVAEFLEDSEQTRLKFPPEDKVYRSILHEIGEAAGLLSFSFGDEGFDRYTMLVKKEYVPSDEELQALRSGEEYDVTKSKATASEATYTTQEDPLSRHHGPSEPTSDYREKYKHIIGGLECAEQSAVKLEPNRVFGYVPSINKRDLRSIEETLNDMKSRKRPKLDIDEGTKPPESDSQEDTNIDTA